MIYQLEDLVNDLQAVDHFDLAAIVSMRSARAARGIRETYRTCEDKCFLYATSQSVLNILRWLDANPSVDARQFVIDLMARSR